MGQSISYKYDPFGRRVEKTISGSTTKYIHSGDQIIEEWEGQTLARKYVYGVGIDEPLVMIASGGDKYYYHFDALGSVRNLTDSTGATVASYEYDVYGAFTLTGSSHGNTYTFTGRQWDGESGLYYYRARHYSLLLGRFLQVDPLGYTRDNLCLYRYCLNSPVNRVDRMGMEDDSAHVECDGDGGFQVDLGWAEAMGTAVKSCVQEHEDNHIDFIEEFWPDICYNPDTGCAYEKGVDVSIDVGDKRKSECDSFQKEYECLWDLFISGTLPIGELQEVNQALIDTQDQIDEWCN